MTHLPRIVVAGTRSGVGKTTVATGLMAALAARGHRVSGHKVGPDFIDPGYHAVATGRPPRNLDAFLHRPERIGPLLAHGAAGCDVAVIEGVMGLFDGRAADDEASTAHVARLVAAPVLLVVDAGAASRSVAAEVHGFATFDPSIRLAGVILNNLGSASHEALVREALAPLRIPVVGAMHRRDEVATPSRHLGLVPAAERAADARAAVAALAEVVTSCVDLDAVLHLARSASPLDSDVWSAADAIGSPVDGRPRIAVSGGAAFTFVYEEHRELLAAAGADVVVLDPLRDERLPPGTAGLYLGGGFPEVHAAQLAANTALAADVRRLVADGGPVVAECGGLLYLCRDLDDQPMTGVLDASARFTDRLTLGYREATTATTGALGPAGSGARGHEFHRTEVTPRAGDRPAWHLTGRRPLGAEGFSEGLVHASFLHASWVGTPHLARALVSAAARNVRVEVRA
ncbi:cobyrinate a,c-diamide synthase [Nitriliruptor alkaliphilus]|uniref:cobyrinate a,c-diamide synthase n=1 Tax=Nitriliruptor alkaliphilus TaxID=427918 RepID=UPI0009FA4990|nr:cobyrinate a,c-diamide synthase [Nitriliruptor alkaliphilus]